jgi:hypothetical protein
MDSPCRLQLIITGPREKRKAVAWITAAALRGPVSIIAASEWLPSYSVARAVRQDTVDVERVLGNVRLARAFTCYQLLDLLDSTRGDGTPVLALDFLHTFFSPDIPLPVRIRTLQACCRNLRRLSLRQPVTVFAVQETDRDYEIFYALLSASVDEVLQPALNEDTIWQPGLF